MAGRKKTIITEEDTGEQSEVETANPEEALDADLEEQLRGIRDSLGGGEINFKVYRSMNSGTEYCGTFGDDFDEESLRQMYPDGGKFVVRVFKDRRYKPPSFTLRIAKSVPKPSEGGAPVGFQDVQIRMLEQQLQWQRDFTMSLMNKNGGMGGGSQQPTMIEMVQTLEALKTLQGGGGSNNMDLILKGMEFARDMEPSGDWKGELINLIKSTGPELLKSMTPNNGGSTPQNVHPIAAHMAGNPPQPLQAVVPPQQPTQEQDMNVKLKALLMYLKSKCVMGVDPNFFVDLLLVNINDAPEYRQLASEILTKSFEDFAQAHDPEIATGIYEKFFRELHTNARDSLRESLGETNDDSMASVSGRESGNPTDFRGNVPTGTDGDDAA